MNLDKKIIALDLLGSFFGQFRPDGNVPLGYHPFNNDFYARFDELISNQHYYNQWFTPEMVRHAIFSWSLALREDKIQKWLAPYTQINNLSNKTIAVIMAGNIPMVGFHDMLCVLMCGHKIIAKTSQKDNHLLSLVAEVLNFADSGFKDKISFTNDHLPQFDGIIATGSNNSSRYFDFYFGKYPNLVRRNRNSVAILSGNETTEELEQICNDVFLYYGLGCRSVSKIYVPSGYSFNIFFKAAEKYNYMMNHAKYGNNYDYNKALYLINKVDHLDNGFLLLTENPSLASPISVLHYETYNSTAEAMNSIAQHKDNVQVLVSALPINGHSLKPGKSQFPELWDYADNIDTMQFLINI